MTLYSFLRATYIICLTYFLCLALYFLFLLIISFFEAGKRALEHRYEDYNLVSVSRFTIPVSILIPALNEGKIILRCIRSVLNLIYPEFEVIVINDASTDGTLDILIEEFGLEERDIFYRKRFNTSKISRIYKSKKYPNLTVLDKVDGGGKAEALNIALDFAKYRYTCNIDADTVVQKDALLKSMRPILLEPDKIVGVGSSFGIINGFDIENGKISKLKLSKLSLGTFQTLEYIRGFIGNRLAWSRLNHMLCICGAFAVWRKDFLYEIGGFSSDFTCEDLEITFRAYDYIVKNKKPYKVVMLPYHVAWTEGPERVVNLIKQRNRWQRVTNETMFHYRHMLFNPKYGMLGFTGAGYFLFYEVLGIFFEVASWAAALTGVLTGYFDISQFFLIILIMILCYTMSTLVSLLIFDRTQRLFSLRVMTVLVLLSFVEFFGYRQIISVARVLGTIDFIRKDKRWHKFERIGAPSGVVSA